MDIGWLIVVRIFDTVFGAGIIVVGYSAGTKVVGDSFIDVVAFVGVLYLYRNHFDTIDMWITSISNKINCNGTSVISIAVLHQYQ